MMKLSPGRVLAVTVLATSLLAACTDGDGRFAELDKNADGKISREEAAADPRLREKFDELDKNLNGLLEQSEFAMLKLTEQRPEQEQPPGSTY